MKFIFFLFILVQTIFGLGQNKEQEWAKDVRIRLFFPSEHQDYTPTNPNVSFKINGKTYTARELRYNTFIFDSIPQKEGTIYLKSKGFQTQWYTITPWDKKEFNYTLGRSGCKYTYQDNYLYLYPYYDRPRTIAVEIGGIEKDSIIDKMTPFFDSLNLKIEFKLINRHNNKVHLTTKDDLHKTIFKLLDHPNIVDARELCLSMAWPDGLVIPASNMGFFSTEIGFKFTQGASTSGSDSLIQAYNLELLRRSGSWYTARLTIDSPGTTSEIIKSLFKEEYIEMVSPRIKKYEQPEIDE